MAEGLSSSTPVRAGPSLRVLAAAALLLALALMAWRGQAVFTTPASSGGGTSPFEASLLSVIEPVAGQGMVRLSVTPRADGTQNILILLDRAMTANPETIRRIATNAAGITDQSGDRLILEQVDFAAGIPGRASREAMAELGLLGILVSVLGWIVLTATPRTEPVAEILAESLPMRRAPTSKADPVPMTSAPVIRPSASAPNGAADLARKDPSRAADILRGWINDKGEAA